LDDRLSQNLGASLKFVHRHELARPVRLANVARADDDGLGSERLHLRGFRSERNSSGFIPGSLLQKPNQW
jgi:hypothetical protein